MTESAPIPIVILTPGFPADDFDTSCLPAVHNYVEALAARHEVHVLAFQYPYRTGHYMWRGIDVYSAGGQSRSSWVKLRTWMRILRELLFLRDRKPIVHSFWIGECAMIGQLASQIFRWKHVMTVGGQEVRRPTHYSRLLRSSRAVLTAGSHHAARSATETLGRGVDAVISLGLDRLPESRGKDRNIDVLGVGSLIPGKRFDDFLSVAATLTDSQIEMVLVGEGPDRESLQKRVDSLGLRITLSGHLPREIVLELMSRSKILLHPSEYESQGYVFLEALASGMHVVCRDVGAPGPSPKVVRCSTTLEMALAVKRLLESEMNFDPENVPTAEDSVDEYEEIYRGDQSRIFGGRSQQS